HGDLPLVRGPRSGRRPAHAPDRPEPLREAQGFRPLQLPRQPDGRSQLEPGSPLPCLPSPGQRSSPYSRAEHGGGGDEHVQPDRAERVPLQLPPQVVDLEPFGLGTNYLQEAGVKGFEETGRPGVVGSFPDFTWSGYSNMSGSAFDQRPKTQDLKVLEWTDDVTLIRGRHIIKRRTE